MARKNQLYMQSGPMILIKTDQPFMYENTGSLIFTNGGEHTLLKTEAHAMGLYGIEVKEDKRFCRITYDDYLQAMHDKGKLKTCIIIHDDEAETVSEAKEKDEGCL